MAERNEHYLEEAIRLAQSDDNNEDPWKQMLLDEMLAMAQAGGIIGVSRSGLSSMPQPEFEGANLTSGRRVKNYPMNLSITFGDAIRAWRIHRNNMRSKALADKSAVSPVRLSALQSKSENLLVFDREVSGIARGLEIPEGVLVTRRTPQDLFKGVQLSPQQESALFPHIPFHKERTAGQVIFRWGAFFELDHLQTARVLDINTSRIGTLSSGETHVPQDLEAMARKMHERFNLPPGLIYTRSVPEDPGIVLR